MSLLWGPKKTSEPGAHVLFKAISEKSYPLAFFQSVGFEKRAELNSSETPEHVLLVQEAAKILRF